MTDIRSKLEGLSDQKYKEFTAKLIPNISPDTILGVRTPLLRGFAKTLEGQRAVEFMDELPHRFYEENNLHGFLIERIADFDECIDRLNAFLPFVNNWATCDSMRPRVFKNQHQMLLPHINRWMADKHPFTVRFGLEMLMCYYLDKNFEPEYLDLAASIRFDEYYVKMMVAWFFATALAKQYDAALPFIEKGALPKWTHNKAIQKSVESYRLTDSQKSYLKTLKIK